MVVNELFVDLFFLPVRREAFHLVFDVTFIFHLTTQTPTRCLFFHTILCLLSPQKNDRNDDGSWKIGFSDAKANRERTLSRVVFTSGRRRTLPTRLFEADVHQPVFRLEKQPAHEGTRDNLALLFIYFFHLIFWPERFYKVMHNGVDYFSRKIFVEIFAYNFLLVNIFVRRITILFFFFFFFFSKIIRFQRFRFDYSFAF